MVPFNEYRAQYLQKQLFHCMGGFEIGEFIETSTVDDFHDGIFCSY